jgi:Fructose-2,6-bisphosphatase
MVHDADLKIDIQTDARFNEIDHGPDENKTETEIIERIGKKSLEDWDDYNVVPDGWQVNPRHIQQSWINFAEECLKNREGEVTAIVSSGGIIRFAPVLLSEPIENPKVRTASLSLFEHDGQAWHCPFWNKRASD